LAAPSNGRRLPGGIDSKALQAPKRFLGAARNIEGGGSLTIIASALVETGSAGDGLISRSSKAQAMPNSGCCGRWRTGDTFGRWTSSRRYPERGDLLAPDVLMIVRRLRKALQALDPAQRVEQLLNRPHKTGNNTEFLLALNLS
jgi:transcription termination factor Rho